MQQNKGGFLLKTLKIPQIFAPSARIVTQQGGFLAINRSDVCPTSGGKHFLRIRGIPYNPGGVLKDVCRAVPVAAQLLAQN